ncbi:MAG TPA: LapA family protein [Beijerinckiaceae bacterium]|nr:LapA family protein [Beijerinckiaceae bacterium]
MRAFLKLVILVPLAVLVVLLAMANRTPVTLSVDPFVAGLPLLQITVPLYVAILGAVMAGIVIGGIASWFGQGKHRKAARFNRRECEKLKAEADRLKLMLPATAALPPAGR